MACANNIPMIMYDKAIATYKVGFIVKPGQLLEGNCCDARHIVHGYMMVQT